MKKLDTSIAEDIATNPHKEISRVEDEINPDEGKSALFSIARVKQGLGRGNYLGLIYTRRDFAQRYNQVIGGDMKFHLVHELSVHGDSARGIDDDQHAQRSFRLILNSRVR